MGPTTAGAATAIEDRRRLARRRLLERDRELELISGLIADARAGVGRVLLFAAASGVGKTSLLDAARGCALDAGMQVLRARGGELERGFAFGAVRQLFEPWLASALPTEREMVVAGAARLSLGLFGGARAEGGAAPEDQAFAVVHGLYWLVANLAARRPLLLLADDVHWWDAPSLRFLAYLIPRVEELPVIVAAASRPWEPGAERELLAHIERQPGVLTLVPRALSERATREVTVAAFADADDEFCRACHRATRGNALLVHELLAALASEGITSARGFGARVTGLGPVSVSCAVLPRLLRLGPGAVELARAVAVLGASAELRHAAALAGLDAERAAVLVDELAAADILVGAHPLGFVHPIVGAAIYADVPAAGRARWHARAARLLDAGGAPVGQVATQLLRSEPEADGFAVEALRAAAAQAVVHGAPEIAASYLARARAEPAPTHEQVQLLLELAAAQAQTHDRAAIDTLTDALAQSADPRERARAAVPLGNLLMLAGEMDAGERVMAVAFAELDALSDQTASDRDLLLAVAAERCTAARLSNSLPDRRVQALVSAAAADEAKLESPGERAIAAIAAGEACVRDTPAARVAALAIRALGGDELKPELGLSSTAFVPVVCALMTVDRFAEAERVFAQVLELARAAGSVRAYVNVRAVRPFGLYLAGRLREAEVDAREALELAGQHAVALLPYAVAFLLDTLIDRGATDEADAVLAETALDREVPPVFPSTMLLARRGRLRRAEGRLAEALADLEACGKQMLAGDATSPGLAPWRSEAAFVHHALGEKQAARRLVSEELELARAIGLPRCVGVALRTQGLISGGPEGLVMLERAVETLAGSPARLEHARALCDLGAARRRARQRVTAREPLRQALEAAHRLGADALAERARTELLATGARPRRPHRTGRDALTPSERRVCEMAAHGLSNRVIAQSLFVTLRTVEVHLNHAYAKLDIPSRAHLAAALTKDSQPPSSVNR
jgi:DNA-binding CsgD family transcriptional regulator